MHYKWLLATGVTLGLVIPGTSSAQTGVTISGFLKGTVGALKLGDSAKSPRSETRVDDDLSRVFFNLSEDLGGGLKAIGQVEMRPTLDGGALSAAGNTFVGFDSRSWGRLIVGRSDLHYLLGPSTLPGKATYNAWNVSLLTYAGGGGSAIAGATRTANVVRWDSPNWNGLAAIVAYSSNATGADADIASGVRKGSAWNFNPSYAAGNWSIGWSHWRSKADGGGPGSDQRADRLYGHRAFGGLRIGLGWDKSRVSNGTTGAKTSERSAWSLPLAYVSGRHSVYLEYTRANDDRVLGAGSGAKMWSAAYAYDLSKRTSIALAVSTIRNAPGAFYKLYLQAAGTVLPGEDPRLLAATLKHSF